MKELKENICQISFECSKTEAQCVYFSAKSGSISACRYNHSGECKSNLAMVNIMKATEEEILNSHSTCPRCGATMKLMPQIYYEPYYECQECAKEASNAQV